MKIDYISVSFYNHTERFGNEFTSKPPRHILGGGVVPSSLIPESYDEGTTVFQAPYPHGIAFDSGLKILWGNSDTVLVSLSGRACDAIDTVDYLRNIPLRTDHLQLLNVSRLDVACDIQSDKRPDELIAQWRANGRIKSRYTDISSTGHTEYIGSKKSDRFVRVYVYNEPHPRAGVPRVEFQFGKKIANPLANELVRGEISVDDIFINAWNKTFRVPWHTSSNKVAPVTAYSERSNAGTVVWFHSQVVPAIKRLIAQGEMSLTDVVRAIADYPDNDG